MLVVIVVLVVAGGEEAGGTVALALVAAVVVGSIFGGSDGVTSADKFAFMSLPESVDAFADGAAVIVTFVRSLWSG